MPSLVELHSLSDAQVSDLLALMAELDDSLEVTPAMLQAVAASPSSHLFAAVCEDGRIVGCATLGVFASPTGVKACVEDVVVGRSWRGQGLGRALLEHIISYARLELAPVEIHLTSRPMRVAANALYASLGFERKETNFYRLVIR